MKAASIQVGATPDKERNFEKILKLIDRTCESYGKLDLVCLPELCYSFPKTSEVRAAAENLHSFTNRFSQVAKKINSYLVAGSFPVISEDGSIYNTCAAFDREGKLIAVYRKIHLFNALGGRESEVYSAGSENVVFDTEFGRVGIIICYDLRFPGTYLELAGKGAKMIAVPAAFHSPRTDHWENLTCSLALSTQCFVIAANQFGSMRDEKSVFCGRSAIIDPWGVAIAKASDKETACVAELDFSYQDDLAKRLPLWNREV